MKNRLWAFILLLLLVNCKPQYLLFDHDPPGLKPKVFAKDLISKNGEHVGYCAFNKSGNELYYAVTTADWFPSNIIKISTADLHKKDTLRLTGRIYETEPVITNDDQNLYFSALWPPAEGSPWHSDIYRAQRTPEGWTAPEQLDTIINSKGSEWNASFTKDQKMYFVSEREKGTSSLNGDIYRVEVKGRQFINRTKLPFPVNTEFNDSDPLIAPDESYLIFHSNRPGGYGEHDLYISFHSKGHWSEPVNMGEEINSSAWEMAPKLTPDGKYLLFTRRKAMVTSEPAQIYWVSTRILKKYK